MTAYLHLQRAPSRSPVSLRALVGLCAVGWVLFAATAASASPCTDNTDCTVDEVCHGAGTCGTGVCVPAFNLPGFVIDLPDLTAYTGDIISTLDHTDPFYTRCCDTNITAYTGESADRDANAVFCPEAPTLPGCYFGNCLCGYRDPLGEPFTVNGTYASPFGPEYLYYAGHAGYDYDYPTDTPLLAARGGSLCKAQGDPVNGHFGFPTAWEAFHTFYIDHGVFAGRGYASWYLHAADLDGQDVHGADLADLLPGQCAPVASGQLVGRVGNVGTLLPHLHFEVRVYEPLDGPEAASSKVIDPYGWTGQGQDPWADPNENPQAESRTAPLWLACGNGRVECGEACDDGNVADGDGCSALCEIEPPGC